LAIQIDIAIKDDNPNGSEEIYHRLAMGAMISACAMLGHDIDGEVSLAFLGEAQMQALNQEYRNKNEPTNVLSFPMEGQMLGDIVLARETIEHEASDQGKTFEDHLTHLIVHGFLHLCGYDHKTNAEAAQMEAIEIDALTQLGIDNPYEIKEPSNTNLSKDR